MKNKLFLRTTLVCMFCIFFLMGIGLSYFFTISWIVVAILAPVGIFLARRRRISSVVIVILFGTSLGLFRGSQTQNQLKQYKKYYNKKVVVLARSLEDAVYADKGQIEFLASRIFIQIDDEAPEKMVGKMRVRGYGELSVGRYDEVVLEAKIMPARGGSRQATMSFASIHVLSKGSGPVESSRRKFVANIHSALPEPMSSFALGLLIGQRNTLPSDLTIQLSHVGLSHVVAVSGYNLTIMTVFITRALRSRSKYQVIVLSFTAVGLFLFVSGFSPSIVRAAWVSVLSLSAWYYGRNIKPIVLVLVPAFITAFLDPLYVFGDLGWYLSFLAFYGVLILAPLLASVFKLKQTSRLRKLIIESLCAQLMTLPLILCVFGEISLISLVANILVVPLVPIAMALSLIAGISQFLSIHLSAFLSIGGRYVLTFMLDIVRLLYSVPGMFKKVKITTLFMVCMYFGVVTISFCLWIVSTRLSKQNKLKYEQVFLE